MNTSKAVWIKTHTRNERVLAESLRRAFTKLRTDNAAAVRKAIDAADAKKALLEVFPAADVKKAIVKAAEKPVRQMALDGGKAEWQQAARARRRRSFALYREAIKTGSGSSNVLNVNLPRVAREAVSDFADELLDQDYWKDIAETLRRDLTRKLERGIKEGISGRELADDVLSVLGPTTSRARANNIARTETTGALNGGHQAVRDELAKNGLIKGKSWLSITDDDTRETHEEANGQEVANDENFIVGGEECRFPGDFSLSAEERCKCRCAGVSTFPDEE